jgi:inosine-uridine nucleoside N-ribohydrolase
LNFESDVRAFEVLRGADVQLTLVPFEICHQVWIRPRDLAKLGEANKIGRFLAERFLGWMADGHVKGIV